ncbi:MAG TPA: PHP-associated domain-containing protein [Mobilitalea sp.]|nr:PHP-associated domain-containing protein [Mobilitalea sp.]
MSKYLYETHLHTKEASACARIGGVEQARYYKEAGYSGIIVTDHFFNGNSCVPKDLPWEDRIDLFSKGYENAKQEGDRIGLDVFFGWEAGFKGTEFLIYGLDKEWLKKQPDILSCSVEEQYKKVHEAGGFVVHAHPFRIRSYISEIRLFPDSVDAVEVINVGNGNQEYDRKASEYAEKYKLYKIAGSDAHGGEKCHSGIAFMHKIVSIQDYIDSIKSREYELLEIR